MMFVIFMAYSIYDNVFANQEKQDLSFVDRSAYSMNGFLAENNEEIENRNNYLSVW
jgi:hypothetical protein